MVGDAEPNHPLFERYTDSENLRHFPDVMQAGEAVIVTEKLHGTNVRIGSIAGTMLAGSHGLQRKRPEVEDCATHTSWFPATREPVVALLDALKEQHRQVMLFGEVYGSRLQKRDYGQKRGLGFVAFDLYVDGKYLDYDAFTALCGTYGVAIAPELGRGPSSLAFVRGLSSGPTTLPGTHIREGVVVKPARERYDAQVGRVVFTYLNDDYLLNAPLAEADTTDLERPNGPAGRDEDWGLAACG